MPAIQYQMHGTIVVVRESTGHEAIHLWSKKGTPILVRWLGFMPQVSVDKLGPGGWGKMPAVAVTCDSRKICGWKQVEPDEYVLCYRVPDNNCEFGWGAYTLTDLLGWPIVITPSYKNPMKKAVG